MTTKGAKRRGRECIVGLILCLSGSVAYGKDAVPDCSPGLGRFVSIQGQIEIRRQGKAPWAPVKRLDTAICAGDIVHSGPRSRAALVLAPETVARLDQNTTLEVRQDAEGVTLEMFADNVMRADQVGHACGAAHIMTRFPRRFKVYTPFLNAAVEGTEFQLALACDQTRLSVFEGRVSAASATGTSGPVFLAAGDFTSAGQGEEVKVIKAAVRPEDAVQWAIFYPHTSDTRVDAIAGDCDALPADAPRGECMTIQAEAALRVGRVDEAQRTIDELRRKWPASADALALASVIAVVKNEKPRARELALAALANSTLSTRAWLALSYVQQAEFDLDGALESTGRAAAISPRSALIKTRQAELLLSLGQARRARSAAREAVNADASAARAYTVLGFANLADAKPAAALLSFEQAITIDSTDPLPRLGIGLTRIRTGDLTAGREDLSIAVALDPTNSLLRSYLGKAYFEENSPEREALAAGQFSLAGELDPNDPTPNFYRAVLLQSVGPTAGALTELEVSMKKNDNKAVIRSRLLLDQDLAARSIALSRFYGQLRVDDLAWDAAASSLQMDPMNPSAHRFISDTYARIERHEWGRISEMLQYQLWQSSLAPQSPRLVTPDLSSLGTTVWHDSSADQFQSLFTANGTRFQASALAGNHGTLGSELAVAALHDEVSLSFGQMHAETNGFRPNNDLRHDIESIAAQFTPSSTLSMLAEFRHRSTRGGDTALNGDADTYTPEYRQRLLRTTARVGIRYSPDASTGTLLSLTYATSRDRPVYPDGSGGVVTLANRDKSNEAELQNVRRFKGGNLILGVGWYTLDVHYEDIYDPGPCPFDSCVSDTEGHRFNTYFYLNTRLGQRVQLTTGLSYDSLQDVNLSVHRVNPKLGLSVRPWDWLTVRLALTRAVAPGLASRQSIEPTQVMGMSQYSDDKIGAIGKRYGIALIARPVENASIGIDLTRRRLQDPFGVFDVPFFLVTTENAARLSADWWTRNGFALNARHEYLSWARTREDAQTYFTTHKIADWESSLRLGYEAAALRMYGSATWTRVVQHVLDYQDSNSRSSFSLLDLALGYRLPNRRGSVALEADNVLGKKFSYQDLNFTTGEPYVSRFLPTRSINVRLRLAL